MRILLVIMVFVIFGSFTLAEYWREKYKKEGITR